MKKVLRVLAKVLKPLLFGFTVVMVLFTIATAFGLNKETGLFGMRMYIVLTDSMSDRFRAGDLAISKAVDPETLEIGDIITFKSADPTNYGAVVTHMIKEKTVYNGQPAFITYGTANNIEDITPVPLENVMGKYAFHIPKAGYLFDTLKTPLGYFLMILLPFLFIITFEGANFLKLLKRYRLELREEAAIGSKALEEEKKRSEEMAQEIERLLKTLEEREQDAGMRRTILEQLSETTEPPMPVVEAAEPQTSANEDEEPQTSAAEATEPQTSANEDAEPQTPAAEATEPQTPAIEAEEQPIQVPGAGDGEEREEEPAAEANDI